MRDNSSDRGSADHGGGTSDTHQGAVVRLAVPEGWRRVETDDGVEAITVADWDARDGYRPTMTASVTPAGTGHAAAQALAAVRATLPDPYVVSIDPWPVSTPAGELAGRRLVLAHLDAGATVSTLVWVVRTEAGDVMVTARVEGTGLRSHDAAFAYAVAGIRLPAGPAAQEPEHGLSADLARRATAASWTDLAPDPRSMRPTMVADPDARILVEASVGDLSLRLDATLIGDEAAVTASASPREVSRLGADDLDAPTSHRIPVTRLALVIAQWLGLGPAWTASFDPVTVPISLVMRRLVDPSVPPPDGVDLTTWQQPWFLWTLRSSATDSGLVMIDAGTSGQCAVMQTEDDDETRFAPLSTYTVWLTLNWLVEASLTS